MSPATRQQFGPYSLNTERDADIIAAFDAVGDGNRIGLLRACVRLAMNADHLDYVFGKDLARVEVRASALSDDEWALIEKARGAK